MDLRLQTRPSWPTVVLVSAATATSGLVHLVRGIGGQGDYVSLLDLGVGTVGLLTAWCLVGRHCFEARLASALLAWSSVLGTALALGLGSPGQGPREATPADVTILVLALLVLRLLHGGTRPQPRR